MQRRVIEDETGRVVLKKRAAGAKLGREGLFLVRDIERRIAVDRVQISMAADQHRAIGLRQNRSFAQQPVVVRKRVVDKPFGWCGEIKHGAQSARRGSLVNAALTPPQPFARYSTRAFFAQAKAAQLDPFRRIEVWKKGVGILNVDFHIGHQ